MQRTICFLVAGLLLALPVSACSTIAAPASEETLQGEITISGAFTLYPLVTRWARIPAA